MTELFSDNQFARVALQEIVALCQLSPRSSFADNARLFAQVELRALYLLRAQHLSQFEFQTYSDRLRYLRLFLSPPPGPQSSRS